MKNEKSEQEYKALASQLHCPVGEQGIKVAEVMNQSNRYMTEIAIESLKDMAGKSVVEIGPGNGILSIPLLKNIGSEGKYLAVDLSKDMIEQSKKNFNELLELNQKPKIELIAGDIFEIKKVASYDGIIAVNLIYFIKDLYLFFEHLKSWLKEGGRVVFAIRSKETLLKLPVSKHGFQIYEVDEILKALESAGFKNSQCETFVEKLDSGSKRQVEVDFAFKTHIITGNC